MKYNQVVNAVSSSSTTVNPNGFFLHGRAEDFSIHFTELSLSANGAGICLFIPYPKITINHINGTSEIDLLIGFFQQDSHVSTEQQRQALISNMDLLSDNFLIDFYNNNLLTIINITKYPEIRLYQGTLTGMMLNLKIKSSNNLCF